MLHTCKIASHKQPQTSVQANGRSEKRKGEQKKERKSIQEPEKSNVLGDSIFSINVPHRVQYSDTCSYEVIITHIRHDNNVNAVRSEKKPSLCACVHVCMCACVCDVEKAKITTHRS